MDDKTRTRDPQWEFALLIRSCLQTRGRYVAEVDIRDAQALVDVRWAARRAGELMGVGVKVELSKPYGHEDSTVTATVRHSETIGLERVLAKEGLQRLLAAAEAVQGAPTIPGPRQ